MRFLLTSVILTILLNVGLRAFPGFSNGLNRWIRSMAGESRGRGEGEVGRGDDIDEPGRQARVIFPWKSMILGSLLLTLVLNILLRIGR